MSKFTLHVEFCADDAESAVSLAGYMVGALTNFPVIAETHEVSIADRGEQDWAAIIPRTLPASEWADQLAAMGYVLS